MEEINRKEYKEAKKELFVARASSIIASTKLITCMMLAYTCPILTYGVVKEVKDYHTKDMTVVRQYVEEKVLDAKGHEEITYLDSSEKGMDSVIVYSPTSKVDGENIRKINIYTGNDVNEKNFKLMCNYNVPAEELFGTPEEGYETCLYPNEDEEMVFKTYTKSDKTYTRIIKKGDTECLLVTLGSNIALVILEIGALNIAFNFKSEEYYDQLDLDGKFEKTRECKEKVLYLKRKNNREEE